jgi:hypothetical protein
MPGQITPDPSNAVYLLCTTFRASLQRVVKTRLVGCFKKIFAPFQMLLLTAPEAARAEETCESMSGTPHGTAALPSVPRSVVQDRYCIANLGWNRSNKLHSYLDHGI